MGIRGGGVLSSIFQLARVMQKVDEFLRHAEDCRSMAMRAASESIREQLLNLAEQWTSLASERKRILEPGRDAEN